MGRSGEEGYIKQGGDKDYDFGYTWMAGKKIHVAYAD